MSDNLNKLLESHVDGTDPGELNGRERKPNGYWRNFENVRSAILEVEGNLGHYPTREELSENGYSTLSAVISKYHGGSEEVKKRMGVPKEFKKSKKMLEVEERIGEPIEVYLEREYTSNRRSTVEISGELEITWASVSNWLNKFEIEKRTTSEQLLNEGVEKPTKRELEKMYVNKRMSTTHIGESIGVSNVTVGKWLKDYDIPVRSLSDSRLQKEARVLSKKKLRKLYIKDRLSMNKIADILVVTQGCIRDYCDKYGIKRRDNSESKLPENFKPPTKRELKKLYYDQEISLKSIGKRHGVSEPKIAKLARSYGIEIRKNESRYRDFDFRKSLVDRLLGIREKEPDQLTSWDFQRTKEDGRLVFAGVLGWYERTYNCKTRKAREILVKDLYDSKPEEERLEELLESYVGGHNGK